MNQYYIYCLHNDDLPEYYVGHTENLTKRMYCHRGDSKRYANLKLYQYINNNGGIDNFKMEVLEEVYCNFEEVVKYEQYYKNLLNSTLNTKEPAGTRKEWKAKYFTNYKCICGLTGACSNRARHVKSKKHIDFIRENIGF